MNTEFAGTLTDAIGRDRIVAGIDTKNGRIAVKGWKAQVELTPDDAMPQLEPYAAAFLYTHVDGEGLLQGFPIDVAARLRKRTQHQPSLPAAFAASRKSMRSMPSALTPSWAWRSTPSCSLYSL